MFSNFIVDDSIVAALDSLSPSLPPSVTVYSVLVAQLCLTLCDPMDWSLEGSSVHEILQERTLEWVDIPFCRRSFLPGF